ncbi:hypothetical protein GCM10009639_54820 [Kitasatospora putterlickiae]|uniref:DUF3618 domain-containing protein n=1 Tax=Kitasatospora putterlickiae TaxID=221725 RepID=A0ABP4J649_9ACTN
MSTVGSHGSDAPAGDVVTRAWRHAGHLVVQKTPDAVRDKAASASSRARTNRVPLLAIAVALAVFPLLRRNRRNK